MRERAEQAAAMFVQGRQAWVAAGLDWRGVVRTVEALRSAGSAAGSTAATAALRAAGLALTSLPCVHYCSVPFAATRKACVKWSCSMTWETPMWGLLCCNVLQQGLSEAALGRTQACVPGRCSTAFTYLAV